VARLRFGDQELKMKFIGRSLVTALAVAVVLALAPTKASAFIYFPHHPNTYETYKPYKFYKHPKIKHAGNKNHSSGPSGHDGLSAAQWYVTGGMFCSAIWLIVHAAYVSQTENRELTRREAYMDVAGCWLPIIGPLLLNQYLPPNY
jgi:hypothetical protein